MANARDAARGCRVRRAQAGRAVAVMSNLIVNAVAAPTVKPGTANHGRGASGKPKPKWPSTLGRMQRWGGSVLPRSSIQPIAMRSFGAGRSSQAKLLRSAKSGLPTIPGAYIVRLMFEARNGRR